MKFVLICDCESTNFEYLYKEEKFKCVDCGIEYTLDEAGNNLLGEVD